MFHLIKTVIDNQAFMKNYTMVRHSNHHYKKQIMKINLNLQI